MKPAVDCWVVW